MSIRSAVKKYGRRVAGTWGRVNHKRDKRAAAKGARVFTKLSDNDWEDSFPLLTDVDPAEGDR